MLPRMTMNYRLYRTVGVNFMSLKIPLYLLKVLQTITFGCEGLRSILYAIVPFY